MIDIAAHRAILDLLHVKPSGIPTLQRRIQRYAQIFIGHSIAELQIHSADHLRTGAAPLLQAEQVSKQIEMGQNPKICFAKIDEYGNMQHSIGV